jgi:hypothetical protein
MTVIHAREATTGIPIIAIIHAREATTIIVFIVSKTRKPKPVVAAIAPCTNSTKASVLTGTAETRRRGRG